ncbi:MAG: hypothetical protein M3229_02635, partial [Actinomycetota bacterium]|nr:hypothetical protein [Actinomycetota bacterium]
QLRANARSRDDRPPEGRPEVCERAHRARGRGLSMRDGRVYTHGPVEWEPDRTGVGLFYGTVGDDPSTYREDTIALFDQPHVSVAQSTQRLSVRSAPPGYVPPEGSVLLAAGGSGFLRRDGLFVSIQASTEELVLSAARALEPMPG